MPLEFRWETLEGWESAVRDRGRIVVSGEHLGLYRVDDGEVVRVGAPRLTEWGNWRYGVQLSPKPQRFGWFRRLFQALPPPPLEGYDPYGLGGPMGGVAGARGPQRWLGSPFMHGAHALTLAFSSVPLAPECPSCRGPMALAPWGFSEVQFEGRVDGSPRILTECALCATQVELPLDVVRPALRLGLSALDPVHITRPLGASAGSALESFGGGVQWLNALAAKGAALGDLALMERVALAIALDERAELDALESEWRAAEELSAIIDGELSDVRGFQAFRARVLSGDA